MRARGIKDNMSKTVKDLEKLSIDIIRHYMELKSFVDCINQNNIFRISHDDIEGTKMLVSKLEQGMSKLNPIQKELVKLRYLDGLDWQLTSESIGCSKRTAYNRNKEAVSIIVQALFGENIERNSVS
jgi:DNA-directed RNA polymerase specialized sigma24 family protein